MAIRDFPLHAASSSSPSGCQGNSASASNSRRWAITLPFPPGFVPPRAPVLVAAAPGSAPPFLLAPGHRERCLPYPGCLLWTGSPLLVRGASLKVETLWQFGDGALPIQAGLRNSFVLSPLKLPKFGTLSRPPSQAAHFLLHRGMATIHLRQQLKMASTGHFWF
jgi:hypothetical protein